MDLAKEPAVRIDGYGSGMDLGQPHGSGGGVTAHAGDDPMRDEQSSLDQTMDSHFNFIQDISAPQELDNLLPQLHETLVQVGQRLCSRVMGYLCE